MIMQRFAYHPGEGVMRGNDLGEYVRFIDAEAAIVAAEHRGYDQATDAAIRFGDIRYASGQRDMLARCVAAVEASAAGVTAWDYDAERALAALRALGGNE